ncbi:hypothetical protein PCK1_002778 [Pneumocystis canis]|nr:hypothetical protein PCK1_002778 [Pneumocystis canis]
MIQRDLTMISMLRPEMILEQGLIYVMGDAMSLVRPSHDPTSVRFRYYDSSWFLIAPFRTIQAFSLVLWIYCSKNPAIANGLTFTLAFFDLIWQFWIFISFRGYEQPQTTLQKDEKEGSTT